MLFETAVAAPVVDSDGTGLWLFSSRLLAFIRPSFKRSSSTTSPIREVRTIHVSLTAGLTGSHALRRKYHREIDIRGSYRRVNQHSYAVHRAIARSAVRNPTAAGSSSTLTKWLASAILHHQLRDATSITNQDLIEFPPTASSIIRVYFTQTNVGVTLTQDSRPASLFAVTATRSTVLPYLWSSQWKSAQIF